MAKVSSLTIQKQSGSDSTHYATWVFNETQKNTTTTVTNSSIKKGSLVSIKSSATTWYNGVAIPSWVKQEKWYVFEVKGNRVVLNQNQSKTHSIMSPIHINNLTGSGGSSSSTTTTVNTLDHYEVKWTYDTGDGVWFEGSSSDVNVKQATYSAPESALRIRVTVKPVAKKRKVNGKDTSYWSGSSVSATYSIAANPPEVPSVPTVEIDKYKLTATIENITDARSDQIQFQILNGTTVVNTGTVDVKTARASYSCSISAGGDYRVRARSVNLYGSTKNYSEWSNYTSSLATIPNPPSGITACRAASETSVYLEWSAVTTATSYDIEYTTEMRYFDGSSETTTVSGIDYTHYEITGLESGDEYFFRVRATNDEGSSAWTAVKSCVIGEAPSAPTTWSSTTTAITGESLTLYWVHNSEDNSKMKYAELEMYVGATKETHTIEGVEDDEEENRTYSYSVNTSTYTEGTVIKWRVRTAGITLEYGDWSIQRTIDIYAPPTLTLSMTDSSGSVVSTLESFPFTISGLAGPNTQAPIGYHVVIVSDSTYQTVDNIGNTKLVNQGDEVYSQYFDTNDPLSVTLYPSDVDLENNVNYTITAIVSMNSGLTATNTLEFTVSWTDEEYEPDAEISVDNEILTAYIRPYCIDEDGYLIEGISLSVYRREYDGSFTEIATGLDNAENTVVVDPHPSLDYARYRIVAITDNTGAVSFYDVPGYPLGETAIIIQWDEEWSNFNVVSEAEMVEQPWAGSFLRLPYNIDVSDSYDNDVSLVEYIGRKHPVSYYGTQLGVKSSWSTEIPKYDKDTLYALRRLAIWQGDVYVREPSGSGYWANINVSFNQTHLELTIPITLEISRVEGGM